MANSQTMCIDVGPVHQGSGTTLGSFVIETHFLKRRRKRKKEKKERENRKKWKKKCLNLAERKRSGRGDAWQCVCCGKKKKKDTRHKFGKSFASQMVTQGACYEANVSPNLDRLSLVLCSLSLTACEP